MDESQLINHRRITKTGVVCQGPCLVYSLAGIGLANADNVYTVHNGQNAEGEVKFRLTANQYSTDFRLFACPLFFNKGLYIAFTTNGEEVHVQYLETAHH